MCVYLSIVSVFPSVSGGQFVEQAAALATEQCAAVDGGIKRYFNDSEYFSKTELPDCSNVLADAANVSLISVSCCHVVCASCCF